MQSTTDLLRVFLQGVMDASGARAASLFAPAGTDGSSEAVLVHRGEGPAVPELAGLAEAESLRERSGAAGDDRGAPSAMSLHEVPSASPDGRLIVVTGVPESGPSACPKVERRRREEESRTGVDATAEVWVGLLGAARGNGPEGWDDRGVPDGLRPLLRMATVLVAHGRMMSAILGDSVTGLPGRVEFEHLLGRVMAGAAGAERSSTLFLVNPDDFGTVNENFGPERGDEIIRAVGQRLRNLLRLSDSVARYGGAIFVGLARDTDETAGAQLGQRLLDGLSDVLALNESFRLSVSIGAACFGPGVPPVHQPADLIRRAEQALTGAKSAGGGCVRFWNPAYESDAPADPEDMSGVFTGKPLKDYRNMKLLSRTVTAIARSADFDELASVVAMGIHSTLKADRVALVDWADDGSLRMVTGLGVRGSGDDTPSAPELAADPHVIAMVEKAREQGRTVTSGADADGHRVEAFAIPLVAGEACLGILYLDGHRGRLALDSSDARFLQALASQLALALDRARLSQVEKEWRETERQQLRTQIDELRQVSQHAELICHSPQMKELMATAGRVAQTDATVLICGESGTGKELISRTIHDLSPRRDKPFVVVDCASIPTTLIESELFGHERGAYTGAQQRKVGRLKEAEGGTVVLDEIGELPLEVQGNLLRFVQEKQLTPIGGNRVFEVNARVVAATNRTLEDEVGAGRFREDLFHRLNVIRLNVPPLRVRPDDTMSLVDLFLRQFSMQYQKGVPRRLSSAAEARVLEYPWPGNVRELRNRILQAVILSRREEIGPAELGLVEDGPTLETVEGLPEGPDAVALGAFGIPPAPARPGLSLEETWDALDRALDQAVEAAIRDKAVDLPPLNRWLTEDLVIGAYRATNEVLTRGAEILGIPEATFRRKLRKAMDEENVGPRDRPEFWQAVSPLLPDLIRAVRPAGKDVLKRARNLLLAIVIRRAPTPRALGAALMGVTEPTFRRWVRELEVAASGIAREQKVSTG